MGTSLFTGVLLFFVILATQRAGISAQTEETTEHHHESFRHNEHHGPDHDEDDDHHQDNGHGHHHVPHRGHPHHGEEVRGQCFCEENWRSLSKTERSTLAVILEFFKSQNNGFTGQIYFREIPYSVDFIFTYLSANHKDIQEINEIYFLSILTYYKLNYGDVSASYANLQYALSLITDSNDKDWSIWYSGYNISFELVLKEFEMRGISVEGATVEILENVFQIITARQLLNYNPVTLPNEPDDNQENVLQIIQEFLITEGGQKSVVFEYFGNIIVSQKVFDYADQNGIDISQINVREFYDIIRVNVETIEYLYSGIEHTLTQIILYIQVQGDRPTGDFNYFGLNVSVEFCLTYLYLQGITIDTINETSILQAIIIYHQYRETYGDDQDLRILLIVDTIRKGQETGSVYYEGVIITITEIRQYLGNDNQITQDQILQIILSIVRNAPTTTQEPTQQLPENLTEVQMQRLGTIVQIIQSGVYDEEATFEFLGIHVSYSFVIQYLELHSISREALDIETLFQIIKEFVKIPTTPTSDNNSTTTVDCSTVSPTGINGTDNTTPGANYQQLEAILKVFQIIILRSETIKYVTYDDQTISVDFCLTYLSIEGISINEADANSVYQAILVYLHYQEQYGQDQDLVLTLILNTLKESNQDATVYYQGFVFSLTLVRQTIEESGYNTQSITIEQFIEVISTVESNLPTSTTTAPEPLGDTPTEQQVQILDVYVEFFKLEIYDTEESISFAGYEISIQYILSYLHQNNIALTDLTSNVLFVIIREYLGTTTTTPTSDTGTTLPPDYPQLNAILKIFQIIAVSIETIEHVTYQNQTISVDFCLTYLSIEGISINEADANSVYQAILVYLHYQEQYGQDQDLVLTLILNTLKESNQDATVYYQGLVFSLTLVRQTIEDSGYNTQTITIEQFIEVISTVESNLPTSTTTAPEPLGDTPTEQQVQILDVYVEFFKLEIYDTEESISFAGYEISIQYILSYLHQNNIALTDLTSNVLFVIIREYLGTTTTTLTSDTGTTLPPDYPQLNAILKIFQIIAVSIETIEHVTYQNQTISVDFCLTYLSIEGISINEADANSVYQAILVYLHYQEQYGQDQDLVLTLILNTLKESNQDATVYYQGFVFSLTLVRQTIEDSGYNTQTITIEQFIEVISTVESNLPTSTTTAPEPLGDTPTEQQVQILDVYVEFFKLEIYDTEESISFAGYEISIQYILSYLHQNNIALTDLTSNVLFVIIREYLGTTTTTPTSDTGTTLPPDYPQLNAILKIFQIIAVSIETIEHVTYQNQTISVDFCLTYLSIEGISINEADANSVYQAILVYLHYQEQYGQDQDLVLTLILNTLKESNQDATVYYQGFVFSLTLVRQTIEDSGYNTQTITIEQFIEVISTVESNLPTSTTTAPEPLGDTPTEQQVQILDVYVEFFKLEIYDTEESISFAGYEISIQYILSYLHQNNIALTDLTSNVLFVIIREYLGTTTTTPTSDTGTTLPPDYPQLNAILKIFQIIAVSIETIEHVTYQNQTISVDFCLTYLSIEGISINEADSNSVYQAILVYLHYQEQYGQDQDLVLTLILNTLKESNQDATVYYQGFVFSLTLVRQTIEDSGYNTQSITIEQFIEVISTVESNLPTSTTTAPEPLGDTPTEQQVQILDVYVEFFKLEIYDTEESISFAGYEISIQYILSYLHQNNIALTDLTSNVLFVIIRQYLGTTPTTPTSDTGTTLPPDYPQLNAILKIFQIIAVSIETIEHVTYQNQTISVDFCLTYLSIEGISINEADSNSVYQAILVYLHYQEQYGQDQDLVLTLILNTLKESNQDATVYYQGFVFSLTLVRQTIEDSGYNTQTITIEQFIEVISTVESNLPTSTTTAPEPLGDTPTEQQVQILDVYVEFFKLEIYDTEESISFAGYEISIQYILSYLHQNNIALTDLTSNVLFVIIREYLGTTTTTSISDTDLTTTPTPPPGDLQLEAILKIFQIISLSSETIQYVTYQNQTISVEFCLTYLSIQGISINEADVNSVYQAILVYLHYQEQYGQGEDLVLILILNTLKEGNQNATVYYQGFIFSLTLVRQAIEDNGYTIDSITIEQFIQVITTVERNLPTTTTTAPEPLEDTPTEEQEQLLDVYVEFLKSGTYDITQYISFFGYRISIVNILLYLNQHNVAITQLSSTILFEIILQYSREPIDTTTTTIGTTTQIPQEDVTVLQSILDDIQTSGLNSSTDVTFHGQVISTSFFITYLSLKRINIHEVTIQQLNSFALEYIEIEQQTQITNSEISIQEAVTLQIILNIMREDEDSGDIIYEGEVISKQFIFQMLLLQNLTIESITYEKLYYIIYIYRVNTGLVSLQNVQVPRSANASLSQVLQFLKQYGENATGSITFNNKRISFQVIWRIIQTSGLSIEQIDVRYLWIAIQILTVGETVDPKEALYENVIAVFKAANEGRTIILQVNGQNLTVDILARILNVSKDSSGNYDTSGLTVEGVWEVVMQYVGAIETGTQQTQPPRGNNILQIFKNAVNQFCNGGNVSLRYNGLTIPVEQVAEKLGLEEDSNDCYNTDAITQQEVIDALNSFVTTTANAA